MADLSYMTLFRIVWKPQLLSSLDCDSEPSRIWGLTRTTKRSFSSWKNKPFSVVQVSCIVQNRNSSCILLALQNRASTKIIDRNMQNVSRGSRRLVWPVSEEYINNGQTVELHLSLICIQDNHSRVPTQETFWIPLAPTWTLNPNQAITYLKCLTLLHLKRVRNSNWYFSLPQTNKCLKAPHRIPLSTTDSTCRKMQIGCKCHKSYLRNVSAVMNGRASVGPNAATCPSVFGPMFMCFLPEFLDLIS
jgi:hypothetical protein